jgi:hypothetical protein
MRKLMEITEGSGIGSGKPCVIISWKHQLTKRDYCRNCGQPIIDGELVIDTWNGEPLEHINCATVRMTLEEVVR